MEKTKKIILIDERLTAIKYSMQKYHENDRMYCAFDEVLEYLDKALDVVRNHPFCERPDNLPDDYIWSEACNPDDRSDPFSYSGDMPVEDFVRMQEEYFANEGNEVLDAADFMSEAKAEEEFENDEENKSAAGFDGCDADGGHDGDGECKRACTYQDCDAERFRVCADHEEQKACSIIQNRQQHED
jgi:hypothetical protein